MEQGDPEAIGTERYERVIPGAPADPGALAAGAPELGRTLEYSGVLPTAPPDEPEEIQTATFRGVLNPAPALPAGDPGLGRTLEYSGVLPLQAEPAPSEPSEPAAARAAPEATVSTPPRPTPPAPATQPETVALPPPAPRPSKPAVQLAPPAAEKAAAGQRLESTGRTKGANAAGQRLESTGRTKGANAAGQRLESTGRTKGATKPAGKERARGRTSDVSRPRRRSGVTPLLAGAAAGLALAVLTVWLALRQPSSEAVVAEGGTPGVVDGGPPTGGGDPRPPQPDRDRPPPVPRDDPDLTPPPPPPPPRPREPDPVVDDADDEAQDDASSPHQAANRALERLRPRCLAILEEAASRRAPADSLRGAIEPLVGRGLREELRRAAAPPAQPRPPQLVALLVDPRWHGILGVEGYRRLEALSAGEPALAPLTQRLQLLRGVEQRFSAALSEAARAWGAADLTWARAVFAQKDPGDPWFEAGRALHAQEGIEAQFARNAAAPPVLSETRSDPAPQPTGEPAPAPPPLEAPPPAWPERFVELEKALRGASSKQKQELEPQLSELLREALAASRQDFPACAQAVEFFDQRARQSTLKTFPALRELLRGLHELYFEQAFARASGPMTMGALAEWCQAHDHADWSGRVEPFLRLAAVSENDKAEKQRTRRARAREAAVAYRAERVAQLEEGLRELLAWMSERGHAPAPLRAELDGLIQRAISRAGDPGQGERLRAALAAIRHQEPSEAREAADREQVARKKLERLIAKVTGRLLKAVDDCIAAGESGLGFELLQLLLQIDPEHDKAHRGLGHVQVEGRWLRKYAAQRWSQGEEWHPRCGWIKRAERARWEAGEVQEGDGSWVPLAEAERRHGLTGDPWTIETEHFTLRSTARLSRVVAVAERLEAFYLVMFSCYDQYFADKGGASLVFGVTSTPTRHQVWFYPRREDYLQHGRAPAGSAGVYDPATRCAYFYDQGEDWSTLQHEVTHQILDETSPRIPGKLAWLAEGAAVYAEDVRLREGAWELPPVSDRPFIRKFRDGVRLGDALSVREVLRLTDQGAWNAGLSTRNYAAAGALVYFLCQADGGRYRGDLVRVLRETYHGQTPSLTEATGLSEEALQAFVEHFYAAQ